MANSNRSAPPFLPPGSIVSDPILYAVKPSHPWRCYIDLEICKFFDEYYEATGVCNAYWGDEFELPPLDVSMIIETFLSERIDFGPGQLHRFYQIRKDSPVVIFVRKNNGTFGPGWFEAKEVDMSLKEYWEGYD